jgi:hypothetical protein
MEGIISIDKGKGASWLDLGEKNTQTKIRGLLAGSER